MTSRRTIGFAFAGAAVLLAQLLSSQPPAKVSQARHEASPLRKSASEDKKYFRRTDFKSDYEKYRNILIPRQHFDETPFDISVDGVRYRIPRNYFHYMDKWEGGEQRFFKIIVSYPGFSPLNKPWRDAYRECYETQKCRLLEAYVSHRKNNSDNDLYDRLRFQSITTSSGVFRHFHNSDPLPGPFGYELYTSGPDIARRHVYIKRLPDRNLAISCSMRKPEERSLCRSFTRLRSGNEFYHTFPHRDLAEAEAINTGLRDLIDSFVVKE